jgi:colicin import membrane protein
VTADARKLQYSAGAFSVLVHVLFGIALIFGISWRTQPLGPAVAFLWDALPPPPARIAPPASAKPAPPAEAPEKPAKPPVAKPAEAKPEPPKPDIALRDQELARKRQEEAARLEEQRRQEEARRKEEERRREEEKRKQAEEKRRQEEKARLDEYRRQETQRELEEEQKALDAQRKRQREEARQQMERDLARQMADDVNLERSQLRQHAEAVARGKMVLDYQDRIRLKIRGLLRMPPLPKSNIEVIFRVNLLPNGELHGRPVLTKPSGVPAYDTAVERAIIGASPLPLPPDKDAAALFNEGLELKFRPYED